MHNCVALCIMNLVNAEVSIKTLALFLKIIAIHFCEFGCFVSILVYSKPFGQVAKPEAPTFVSWFAFWIVSALFY